MVQGLQSNSENIYMVKLDKTNLPPTTPATLTASASGKDSQSCLDGQQH